MGLAAGRYNPLSLIRMPKNNLPRVRHLKAGEYEKLEEEAKTSCSWYLWPIIVIAIETGIRRGEILGLHWEYSAAKILLFGLLKRCRKDYTKLIPDTLGTIFILIDRRKVVQDNIVQIAGEVKTC